MIRLGRFAFIVFAVMATSSFSARAADPPAAGDGDHSVSSQRVPALLFPGATVVRAFGGKLPLQIGNDGAVTMSQRLPDGRTEKTKADGGETLNPAEIAVLRKSVFYAPPPPVAAACCLPRHGFVFFDAAGRYLGYLKVCFQCGCAELDPAPPHDPAKNWLVWDKDAIRRILEAHHLPVAAPAG
ncbi:MAG TPA: hypothetical protein VKS60_03055 [Stellaceae bacterium]|nr:hypothetical protein [Stellaceae bacterium]